METILVTGGTGYIGSHTVVELIESGYEVKIIDNLSNSSRMMVDCISEITGVVPHFTQLDITDKEGLEAYLNEHGDITGIIHFAALKSVNESVARPLAYYRNNVEGLVTLLQVISGHEHIERFVFSSSCTVYGTPAILPVTEDTPIGLTPSPYGATKQMCERILEDYANTTSAMRHVSLRYFNPIGAHHSGLIGELPSGIPNNLMPYITQTAAGIRERLYIFGDDYDTVDGTAVRDYIHVSDLATAHVHALSYLDGGQYTARAINVGTGRGSTVLQIVKAFEEANGLKLSYEIVDRRAGDVEAIYADASLSSQLLNWTARRGLGEMCKSAWTWERKRLARDNS